jgi:hypothetical protein
MVLIPGVGGPIIIRCKEHIDILLVLSPFYCFDEKEQDSEIPTPRRHTAIGGIAE